MVKLPFNLILFPLTKLKVANQQQKIIWSHFPTLVLLFWTAKQKYFKQKLVYLFQINLISFCDTSEMYMWWNKSEKVLTKWNKWIIFSG